jgi:cell division protein FtsQ
MAQGGRARDASRRRARAASVVVPFPLGEPSDRLDLVRLVPSGRSLLVALLVVTGSLGAYWGARVSPVFDVQRVRVVGAAPDAAREVQRATQETVGTSLLALDQGQLEDTVRLLPSIAAVSVDRAFPHTLVVKVAVERTVAVARRGHSSWLVTASGRVVRPMAKGSEPRLPRIWLTRAVPVRLGSTLPATYVQETRVLAALREARFRRLARGVRVEDGELTIVLRNGPELRLGEPVDVALKLAVAKQVFPRLRSGTQYLDLSVPERPVAGTTLNS